MAKYIPIGLRGMLKDTYRSVSDIVCPLGFRYEDTWKGFKAFSTVTHIHFVYTDMVTRFMSSKYSRVCSTYNLGAMGSSVPD